MARDMPSKAEYTRRSIRFKTSRTYLQTLFPRPAFSFATPGTVAEASYRVDSVDKLEWLNGGGYHSFGLWIHGVQCAKQDGSTIYGTYLPVLFKSSAESIPRDREELGMPSLFCETDVRDTDGSVQVQCGLRGSNFATLEWGGLKEAPKPNSKGSSPIRVPPTPPDNSLLLYRYIPAVGQGPPDAEYPVFIPNKASSESRILRSLNASSAKASITEGSGDTLPTIHHVTQALAESLVYSTVEAKIEHGLGLDFGQPEKIEEGTGSIGSNLYLEID
jgi:hypothetical protein